MELEMGTPNVHLAGNSRRFCDWISSAFSAPCTFLLNQYYLDGDPNTGVPLFRWLRAAGGRIRRDPASPRTSCSAARRLPSRVRELCR